MAWKEYQKIFPKSDADYDKILQIDECENCCRDIGAVLIEIINTKKRKYWCFICGEIYGFEKIKRIGNLHELF